MPEARLDQYIDELAIEIGPVEGDEYERDTFHGLQLRAIGSDLFLHGRYGTIEGDRSAGFFLDNQVHSVRGTGKFWVFGDLLVNGSLFTGSGGAPQPGTGQQTYLVSGGEVTHQTGYDFLVSSATYRINGDEFTSAQSTVSLSAADATFDRIDVIAVDNTGAVVVIEGTAASTPSEPTIDPAQYLKLALVLVPAATAAPPTVTTTALYGENTGGPSEWNWSTSGTGWTLGSTAAPRSGTKSIEGTTTANNSYAQGQHPSTTINPNSYELLILYIRSKAAWGNNRTLIVRWYNAGAAVGTAVTIARTGTFGFDSSNTTAYQQIAIPVVQFAIPSGTLVNQLRITHQGQGIGFYLDDIALQTGATSGGGGSSGGMTQAQADARYAQTAFAKIAVSGQSDVDADQKSDTLTLVAGSNITITTSAGSDQVTIAAAGGGGNAFGKVAVAGQSDVDADAASDTLTLEAGSNITITTTPASDKVTIAAASGGNAFGKVIVSGQSDVDADAASDTLELEAGSNITITTTPASDKVTIAAATPTVPADIEFDHVGIGTPEDASIRLLIDGQYGSLTNDKGSSGTSITVNWHDGNTQLLTLTGNCVLTFSNPIDGGRYLLLLEQDGTGSRTVTWPSNVKWKAGTAPTLTTTAGHVDLCTFVFVAGLGASGNYLAAANLDYTPA